jgi:hypothetical protein
LYWQKQKHQIHWIKYFSVWFNLILCSIYAINFDYCCKLILFLYSLWISFHYPKKCRPSKLYFKILGKYDVWSFTFHYFLENGRFYRENTCKCSPLVTKWQIINSNFSVLISSCNFDVEKYSLCVYVRYEYTEWRHWSRAAREL